MEQNGYQDRYLAYDEAILLKNKSFFHKLALAVQLKHYLSLGSFPKGPSDVNNGLVSHLSQQLETNRSILDGYHWSGRPYRKRHDRPATVPYGHPRPSVPQQIYRAIGKHGMRIGAGPSRTGNISCLF